MAFHGALVGCLIAIWVFARRNGVNPWSTGDLVTAAVPIGLFFGRIANFINGELFGRPTTLPWGMVFPEAALHHPDVEPTPRHPSQLYEAVLEGLVLFLVLRLMTHYFGALKRPGLVSGVFLAGYALARSTSELFREPHFAHAFNIGPLTPGIVYSIPMLLLGLLVGVPGAHPRPEMSGGEPPAATPLALKLAARIARDRVRSNVADYMQACLQDPEHGYYRRQPAIGSGGDFVTAPEISQVFGEIIGLWCAVVWQQMGSPPALRLIELGPGRGTLMLDVLRAARLVPAFRAAHYA